MDKNEGKLVHVSVQFSIKILRFFAKADCLNFMKNQLGRAATSIGANIHEAYYAESRADFIHKMKIALKEAGESDYWLKLMAGAYPHESDTASELRAECGRIRRMLIACINTASTANGS